MMAVLDAIGLLGVDRAFVYESLVGTRFAGRVAGRTAVGEHSAIVPEIEGSAWITGEHTFFVDEADPLGCWISGVERLSILSQPVNTEDSRTPWHD